MPRSILKSRRSEESLSPLSDDCVPMIPSGAGASGSMTGMSVFRKKRVWAKGIENHGKISRLD